MKKPVLLLITALLISSAVAQIYVGHAKYIVKIHTKTEFGKAFKSGIQTETDSSYAITLRGDFSPEEIYFKFDKLGNCYSQKWAFSCDTCYHKMLKNILGQKKYQWKQISPHEYLSKFSKQFKVTENTPGQLFTITQLYIREQDYMELYNKGVVKQL